MNNHQETNKQYLKLKFEPQPIELTSPTITLRPLTIDDVSGFHQAGNYPQLWQWVIPNQCMNKETTRDWIEYSLNEQDNKRHVPFVIVDNKSNKIIGSSRYCSIRTEDRNIEIGFTFVTPQYQRTQVNTQAKLLLLQHAFEQLGAIRVELRTHEKNQQSRNAIARIGAKFEGILRNNRILADGSIRNSAMFSITEQEWSDVKSALIQKLTRN
jgi:RimJ/RimL family protein N-acetyltransferase